ncbi:Uncharacterised protein [Ectopseudomonas mendocina]|uniref:Uncharacterized protein n=1 Tax=Ectopseudomonas mendocina TaxID=300 RepID=A0A379PM45_ECTME|nr:hypothetical protein [Pseudomonas mendocina]SUE95847.1 Uncharacterised protein [Pseudomonas mendocina]
MSEVENIDELEALLADLADLEEEGGAVAQEVKPEPEKPQEKTAEPTDEDVAALIEDLELEETVAPEPVVEAPVAESNVIEARTLSAEEEVAELALIEEGIDDEVEALLEAAAIEEPAPVTAAPVAKPTPAPSDDAFVPESDLRTFINPDKLKSDLDFNETNISTAMMKQASLFAHYATLAHQAQFQADRADQQVDLVEAKLYQQYRDSFASAGEKPTEAMIKASIIKDDRYQKALLRKSEAKAIADMVKAAADSFRHRRDMLIQVGADLRQEILGNLRTKETTHPGKAALERMSA